jgi:hypothetical protein
MFKLSQLLELFELYELPIFRVPGSICCVSKLLSTSTILVLMYTHQVTYNYALPPAPLPPPHLLPPESIIEQYRLHRI